MRLWYHMGPGQEAINNGIDFLKFQTSSQGYHSVIQGESEAVGDFTLVHINMEKGKAIVRSTTPFDRNIERGILRGGMGVTGDLHRIVVDNSHDEDVFLIDFSVLDTEPSGQIEDIGAQTFLNAASLGAHQRLGGPELQQIFFRYKQLEDDLQRQTAFWQSTNDTLSQAMMQLREREAQLQIANDQLQAAQNKSELLKAAIIDVALDVVITIDEQFHLVEFSASTERMFGYQRDQLLGRNMIDLIVPAHLRQQHREGLKRYLDTGESKLIGQPVTTEALHADGHTFPVELSISAVHLTQQRLFTAYIRDLSEKKQAEREIERQREALYQSEKLSALGSLLAGVAHELNNPLSIVVGRSMMLTASATDEATSTAASKILEAAERCTRIVKTFLAMARRQEPERTPANLNDIIAAALELVGYSLRTASIEVNLVLDPDLPDLLADESQLNQVFTNLFINAQQALFDAPEPRTLQVTTRYDAINNTLHAVVTDNGPGVPEGIRSRIFEPFYTTKPVGSGTGVGLSLSYGIVTAHGGTIVLQNPAAGGAQFVMTLPHVAVEPQSEAGNGLPPVSAAAARILIVDDEPAFADMLQEMLGAAGHQTSIALSGREALTQLAQQHFDVILTDLHMPDINGPDFFRQLKASYPHMVNRLAFITGDTLGSVARRFLSEAELPYLEKPCTPQEVEALIQQLLS